MPVLVVLLLIAPPLEGCGRSAQTADRDPTATASAISSSPQPSPPPGATATVQTGNLPAETPTEEESNTRVESPDPTIPATQAPEPDPSLDLVAFQHAIRNLVAESGGITSIVVMQPDGEVLYENIATEPLEAASLYKLVVMVELFRQREEGVISFDEPVLLEPHHFAEGSDALSEDEIGLEIDIATLLDLMITASSNVAATALLQFAGTDNVNATTEGLGLVATEIRWYPGGWPGPGEENPAPEETLEPTDPDEPDESDGPEHSGDPETGTVERELLRLPPMPFRDDRADSAWNVTSAADVAGLYRMLLAGEVVSAEASQEMLDLLAHQGISDRLPAYLPEGTVVAHKTGNLEGLVHDAGVIYAPAGPVIVAVMTEDVDEGYAVNMIAEIGLLTYGLLS